MYAVGMSGIFFDYKPWVKLAFNILTEELPRQNYEYISYLDVKTEYS